MKLAKQGDNKHVDLLVKDIYGGHTPPNLGLNEDVIAASFGKINEMLHMGKIDEIKKEDIIKGLLVMICYHIAQLAYLSAKQGNIKKYIVCFISRVYYFGNFSRRGSYAIEWLDFATKFWDKDLSVRFNKYDGSLGAIGTLTEYD